VFSERYVLSATKIKISDFVVCVLETSRQLNAEHRQFAQKLFFRYRISHGSSQRSDRGVAEMGKYGETKRWGPPNETGVGKNGDFWSYCSNILQTMKDKAKVTIT